MTIVLFLPLGFYLAYRFTDWSVMYTFDAPRESIGFAAVVALAYLASFCAGFAMGVAWLRRGQRVVARLVMGGVAVALGAFTLATWSRLMQVGTREQFLHGGTEPFLSVRALLIPNAAVGTLYAAGMGIALFAALRAGQRHRNAPA
ncbi:MAG: hypothetical protein HYY13_10250 [Nitrospirae bacterium]|nr:hypothetical protein [Nitrospirota bacterium]